MEEEQSASTASWLSHRAFLAPSSVKRGKQGVNSDYATSAGFYAEDKMNLGHNDDHYGHNGHHSGNGAQKSQFGSLGPSSVLGRAHGKSKLSAAASKRAQSYDFDKEYDPSLPNDYEKVSRIMSAKAATKDVVHSSDGTRPTGSAFSPPIGRMVLKNDQLMAKPVEPGVSGSSAPHASGSSLPHSSGSFVQHLSGDEMLMRRLAALEAQESSMSANVSLRANTFSAPEKSTPRETKTSVALKMMEKMGWKEGEGLGKHGQGMATPLIAQSFNQKTGRIVKAAPIPSRKDGQSTSQVARSTHSTHSDEPSPHSPIHSSRIVIILLDKQVDMEELEETVGEYGSIVNIKDLEGNVDAMVERMDGRVEGMMTISDYKWVESAKGSSMQLLCEYETLEEAKRAVRELDKSVILQSRVTADYFPEDIYNTL